MEFLKQNSSGLKNPSKDNTAPGVTVGFFIDGQPSVTFIAMTSLEGSWSHNFFDISFTNMLQEPKDFVSSH